ncbi:MAG TPA: hypothetical protein P5210_08325 [Draconibacterium sp.]|nr:hypothetical protein [Draconibacterium sp.]HRX11640.1 hypothetical protein [Draconibacterium sp.]
MISNILRSGVFFLFSFCLLVFTACEKDEISEPGEELTDFEFPRITYVDSLIYLEIQKTCKERWDLKMMDSESLIILSYKNDYTIYCEGQQDNQYYWFVISTDLNGKWISGEKSPYSGKGSVFNLKSIGKLKLEDIKGFWKEGSTLEVSNNQHSYFDNYLGYLDNESIFNNSGQVILLSFFKSKEDAVNAMELRRNTVASVISQGNSTVLPGLWWYTEMPADAVFVSRWNVLLEIHIGNSENKPEEDAMYNTANEIIRRMSLLLD